MTRIWIGVFLASLLHGIQAGTDTSNPIVFGCMQVTVAVFGLVAHRMVPVEPPLAPQDGG